MLFLFKYQSQTKVYFKKVKIFKKATFVSLQATIAKFKAQWPHGWCPCLQIEWSGFQPWPRTLWVVFLVKTLNSHSASLHPGVEMKTSQLNAGSNPAMD